PVKARPLPPTAALPWAGFYLGVNAGYAWGRSDPSTIASVTGAPFFFSGTVGPAPRLAPSGFIGGGQLGYNLQSGRWVVGGEADFSGVGAKADASLSPFFLGKGNTNTVAWSSRYDWLFTARLRAGYLLAPNWLVYATGGLALTQVKDSAVCTVRCGDFPIGVGVTWSDSETLVGGTVGGGVEVMFAPRWTARAEYLYAKFRDTMPPVTSGPASTPPIPALFSFNHDLNVVRFAINYILAP